MDNVLGCQIVEELHGWESRHGTSWSHGQAMAGASQQALRRPADRLQALDSPARQAGGPGYDVLEVELQVHRRERPQRPQPGLHQGTDGCSICTTTQLPCSLAKGEYRMTMGETGKLHFHSRDRISYSMDLPGTVLEENA